VLGTVLVIAGIALVNSGPTVRRLVQGTTAPARGRG